MPMPVLRSGLDLILGVLGLKGLGDFPFVVDMNLILLATLNYLVMYDMIPSFQLHPSPKNVFDMAVTPFEQCFHL